MIARFGDGRDWFFENRFGMFVHWGIYAASGWHEQVQWRCGVPKAEYVHLAESFNPVAFDPDAWLDLLQGAGMSYITFTTKHHDGFCMWDTALTDYGIMHTPYGQDVLAKLAEACHRRGVRLCLYYSCPDWHHPHSINLGGDHQLAKPNPGDSPDLLKYVRYVQGQVTELCTRYGRISGFFWDIPPGIVLPEMNALLRRLQPEIIINDRGYDRGDYSTPERHVPEGEGFTRPTEACQSVGQQSWGYRENEDYFSPKFLMQSVARILSMGGNYLLNVGPKADGTIPAEAADIVRRVGDWYGRVRAALEAPPAPKAFTRDRQSEPMMATRRDGILYLVFPTDPRSSGFALPPYTVEPVSATVLNDGTPLATSVDILPYRYREPACLHIAGLPVDRITDEPMVVALDFGSAEALDRAAAGSHRSEDRVL